MIDTQLPCALFVSDFTDPEALTTAILKDQNFPKCNYIEGNIRAFPWKIDTKYYQTTIHLCPVKDDTALPESVIDLMEAAVLYFDTKSINSFENLKKWFNNIGDDMPEILLLICDTFKDNPPNSVSRSSALNWCLSNGFELIELNNSDVDDDNIDYNIIPDKKGIERVIEALHAHMWPNLDMKESPHIAEAQTSNHSNNAFAHETWEIRLILWFCTALRSVHECNNAYLLSLSLMYAAMSRAVRNHKISLISHVTCGNTLMSTLNNKCNYFPKLCKMYAGNSHDDGIMDSFSELFSQLNSMKESISSLPMRDRHTHAEQIVSSFWKAIGGDEEELEDTSEQ